MELFSLDFVTKNFHSKVKVLSLERRIQSQLEFGIKVYCWLVDGSIIKFGKVDDVYDDFFVEGDFVGLGLIHRQNSKIECFVTCNGKLLGKILLKNN